MTGGSLNNVGSAALTFTDPTPNTFTFDTFGVRPSSATDSATNFDSTLFKVEFILGATPASVDLDPQDQSVLVGQDASFSVQASGTIPLGYQWYYITNNASTLLNNETNSTLTIGSAQLTNAGGYFVTVTNAYGSATSAVAQLHRHSTRSSVHHDAATGPYQHRSRSHCHFHRCCWGFGPVHLSVVISMTQPLCQTAWTRRSR